VREFFVLVNEYPWTTFLLLAAAIWLLDGLADVVKAARRGPWA